MKEIVLMDRNERRVWSRKIVRKALCALFKFRVGAALLTGTLIYTGCNASSSLGATCCAEKRCYFKFIPRLWQAGFYHNFWLSAVSKFPRDLPFHLRKYLYVLVANNNEFKIPVILSDWC